MKLHRMCQTKKTCHVCLEDKSLDLFKGRRKTCTNCLTLAKQKNKTERVCKTCYRSLPLVAFKRKNGVHCKTCAGIGGTKSGRA
jgi:hypothetical protein